MELDPNQPRVGSSLFLLVLSCKLLAFSLGFPPALSAICNPDWQKQQPYGELSDEEKLKQTEIEERQLTPEEAARRYQALLAAFEAAHQPREIGRVKLGLARVALRQRETEKAEELARSALEVLQRTGDVRYTAMAQFELANILFGRGEPEQSLTYYQAALPGFRETKDAFQEGRTLNGIGNVYFFTGFYEKAWENYLASYAIGRDTQNEVLLGRSLNNLGGLAEATGRYAEAIEFLQQSVELKLRGDDQVGAARSYNGLGNVYFRLGNYPKALDYYNKAYEIFQAQAPAETSVVLNNIGTVLKNMDRYAEALEYLQKAYEVAKSQDNPLEMVLPLNNQGYVYSRQGRLQESLSKHEEALKLARGIPSPEDELHALHGIAISQFRLGQYPEAADTFRRVLFLADQLKNPDESAGGHNGLGRSYEQLGKADQALTEYKAAVETIESTRAQIQLDVEKAEYLENNLEAYANIVHLLTKTTTPEVPPQQLAAAFSFAERGRARALLELLAESRGRIAPKVEPSLANELEKVMAEITAVQNQIRDALAEGNTSSDELQVLWQESDRLYDSYQTIQRKVRLQDPNYASLQSPEPISLKELQHAIPADTVFLEYVFDHRRNPMGLPQEPWGLCFAVTREKTRLFEIESVPQLADLTTRLREAVVQSVEFGSGPNPMGPAFLETAQALYQLLVAPAGALLAGKQRVVIVPDRFLTAIPLEVLLTSADHAPPPGHEFSWAQLPYLIRRFAISYAPSATIYAESQSRAESTTPGNKDLLALADPIYEGEQSPTGAVPELLSSAATQVGFARLPYSSQEALAVGKLFLPARRNLLFREKANEGSFRQAVGSNTYSYLLFSVHGVASERYPQFSSLILTRTPGSSDDGLLQVHEIYNLRLPSKLVVLSACETALGKDIQGEGLVGLVRAFHYAGARSVVASLWRVDDESTSHLMASFFGEVKRQPRGPAIALQRAKLEMLRKPNTAHPFFWAPFILSGRP